MSQQDQAARPGARTAAATPTATPTANPTAAVRADPGPYTAPATGGPPIYYPPPCRAPVGGGPRRPWPVMGSALNVFGVLLWSFVVFGQFTTSWMSGAPLAEGTATLFVFFATLG